MMKGFRVSPSMAVVAVLIILTLLGAWRYDGFLSTYNVQTVLRYNSMFALVALGMCFVIMTGGIDLSVGSVAAFSSVVAAHLSGYGLFPGLLADWPQAFSRERSTRSSSPGSRSRPSSPHWPRCWRHQARPSCWQTINRFRFHTKLTSPIWGRVISSASCGPNGSMPKMQASSQAPSASSSASRRQPSSRLRPISAARSSSTTRPSGGMCWPLAAARKPRASWAFPSTARSSSSTSSRAAWRAWRASSSPRNSVRASPSRAWAGSFCHRLRRRGRHAAHRRQWLDWRNARGRAAARHHLHHPQFREWHGLDFALCLLAVGGARRVPVRRRGAAGQAVKGPA
jgi:hypothetical protein